MVSKRFEEKNLKTSLFMSWKTLSLTQVRIEISILPF